MTITSGFYPASLARTCAAALLAGAFALAQPVFGQADKTPPLRSIEHVKGDVYLLHDSDNEWKTPHGAMFVVTKSGIVVTDPITDRSVKWLKEELKKRFKTPVTHMFYSHAHSGHNSGGEAWGTDQGIEVIAHEKTKKHIKNGMTKTAMPTRTFADKYVMKLGGKTFEATYLGEPGHSDDLVALVVKPENVGFVVDLVTPNRLPLTDFPHTHIGGMIDQLKAVEALDFDVLVPGHGAPGKKSDVKAQRVYIEELMAAVAAELKAGKSVDEIVKTVKMEKYKDWVMYKEWIEANVRGMAKWLKENKTWKTASFD